MRSASRVIVVGLAVLALATSAFAQTSTPLEQLQAAVAEYQKAPGRDTALMVIQLYKQLDPPPAVPEEARRPFVMATTVFTESRDSAGIAKAIEFLSKAIFIAPWWSEARYNRAIAYEAAGQLAMAIEELKLYLGFNLTEAERREAQDRIYALEAKAEMAAEQRRAEEARAAEERRVANVAEAARAAEQRRIASAAEEARLATQARRAVITQIRNAVGNRSYVSRDLSYKPRDRNAGISQNEIFGGGTYYMYDRGFNMHWKFFDERAELWGRLGEFCDGAEVLLLVGESWGPTLNDMRWFDGQWASVRNANIEKRIWAHIDLTNGFLYTSHWFRPRPLDDSGFDPNKRYSYELYKPAN